MAPSANSATLSPVVMSGGVEFRPPHASLWRIGRRWYDFTPFLEKHPGGAQVLLLSRDRYEDCTFVFEAHHHHVRRARAIIKQYEVPDPFKTVNGNSELRARAEDATGEDGVLTRRAPDSGDTPLLLPDSSFYSVLRKQVAEYLIECGHPDGGPLWPAVVLFWAIFVVWCACHVGMLMKDIGCWQLAIFFGIVSSWLGGYGHNWVHQPNYYWWAVISLDGIGLTSDEWIRTHLLQHHMYVNTPWDNHFKGTDPFLITDPTVERCFAQRYIWPSIYPVFLSFGIPSNFIVTTIRVIRGEEIFTVRRLLFPLQIAAFLYVHGLFEGLVLAYAWLGTIGVFYFTLALLNHNIEKCLNVNARNNSQDWAHAQLLSCVDWGVQMPFWQSLLVFLGLNYHAIHHLFPKVDFSHHKQLQAILLKTCATFGIEYSPADLWTVLRAMPRTFADPCALGQEILVYAGGL
eukprot:GEMP01015103.1.p1 GENE.GEMP01015103.1~~GEMP01015103.1.p1  ORF type:complete len:459 (+),score=91.61 GEMP01015103.1:184-1560(+)